MIYAAPGAAFQAVVSDAPAGLVGTLGVRVIENRTGATIVARSTALITEPIAGSGTYIAQLVAPGPVGAYTVFWDQGGAPTPATTSIEELIVSTVPATTGVGGGTGSPVEGVVASILEEGNFDATQAQALKWLEQRHKLMCSRAKCVRRKLGIGPTVANQAAYAVPAEVQEIREVQVQSSPSTGGQGVPYGAARTADLAQGALGYLWLGGLYLAVGGGIFVRDESGAGEDLLALYPTPTEAGLGITLRTICRPAPLALNGALSTPPEFDDALIAGAIATGLARLEARPDLASPGEAQFSAACAELLAQVNKRYRGSGPAQIRVAGMNA